jgi:hypothetical protein
MYYIQRKKIKFLIFKTLFYPKLSKGLSQKEPHGYKVENPVCSMHPLTHIRVHKSLHKYPHVEPATNTTTTTNFLYISI